MKAHASPHTRQVAGHRGESESVRYLELNTRVQDLSGHDTDTHDEDDEDDARITRRNPPDEEMWHHLQTGSWARRL